MTLDRRSLLSTCAALAVLALAAGAAEAAGDTIKIGAPANLTGALSSLDAPRSTVRS